MTRGEKMVVLVRAQALSDSLRWMIGRLRERTDLPVLTTIDGFEEDVVWQAQRLRSACERALGTRVR